MRALALAATLALASCGHNPMRLPADVHRVEVIEVDDEEVYSRYLQRTAELAAQQPEPVLGQ